MSIDFEGIDLPDEQKEALQAQAAAMLEGMVSSDEVTGMKSKLDELLSEKKKEQAKAKAAADLAATKELEAAAKNGDVESLQKALQEQQEKYANLEGSIAKDKEQGSIKDFIDSVLSEHVTQDRAARMFIENELKGKVGYKEGQIMPVNDEGALTGATLSELVNSVVSDPSNKPYMIASNASGGGAAGGQKGNGGAVDLSKMTKTQVTQFANENPDKYQELMSSQQH